MKIIPLIGNDSLRSGVSPICSNTTLSLVTPSQSKDTKMVRIRTEDLV